MSHGSTYSRVVAKNVFACLTNHITPESMSLITEVCIIQISVVYNLPVCSEDFSKGSVTNSRCDMVLLPGVKILTLINQPKSQLMIVIIQLQSQI